MDPKDTGEHYDRLALWYQQNIPETYGMKQLERALRFVEHRRHALDVGCGSNARFLGALLKEGFATDAVDISSEMVALAKARHPEVTFYVGDICQWSPPRTYDFISAWDSTFHLPVDSQKPVLEKLCRGLNPRGILLFTGGGGTEAGEITGSFQGEDFGYSTLGVEGFLSVLRKSGCHCRHVEYDQHPENHVYFIAQKI